MITNVFSNLLAVVGDVVQMQHSDKADPPSQRYLATLFLPFKREKYVEVGHRRHRFRTLERGVLLTWVCDPSIAMSRCLECIPGAAYALNGVYVACRITALRNYVYGGKLAKWTYVSLYQLCDSDQVRALDPMFRTVPMMYELCPTEQRMSLLYEGLRTQTGMSQTMRTRRMIGERIRTWIQKRDLYKLCYVLWLLEQAPESSYVIAKMVSTDEMMSQPLWERYVYGAVPACGELVRTYPKMKVIALDLYSGHGISRSMMLDFLAATVNYEPREFRNRTRPPHLYHMIETGLITQLGITTDLRPWVDEEDWVNEYDVPSLERVD